MIAFVLAFLFRTFEAEAFVIPTGSMAPTLMGRHKDVECPQCGYRYRVSASDEEGRPGDPPHDKRQLQVVAGTCPICRYTMPMRPDLPPSVLDNERAGIESQESYSGDRILVNKYLYTLSDPRRWDVIVFHYPGDAETNFIKRLVGLPGEKLRIYQGDLFVGNEDAEQDADFAIARKPPDKVLATRSIVHDTDFDPAGLYEAGWPLRWYASSPTGVDGWQTETQIVSGKVRQRYTVDRSRGGEAWLRYQHLVPNDEVWNELAELQQVAGATARFPAAQRETWRPQLIMDFNAYNTRMLRHTAEPQRGLGVDASKLGLHWVGDLMMEADVALDAPHGELLLDLVEAGKHFTCRIDLATGQATLGIDGVPGFAPAADAPLTAPGECRVAFANVDDQLLLWIDGHLIQFDKETTYSADEVFGGRRPMRPQTNNVDRGDLAPAGIGARDAKLAVTRLKVWRDIYYIADSWRHHEEPNYAISDFRRPSPQSLVALASDSDRWDEYTFRRPEDFQLGPDHFFVMGDNSPESSDARLWFGNNVAEGRPSGPYLERKLLIGKAVVVYWPHAWYTIPFTNIPVWPNWRDMRLVR